MGKCFLAKVYISKLYELPESEVSELTRTTIDEPAFAVLKRQGSRGITFTSSNKKFIFDTSVSPILMELTDKILQTGSNRLPNRPIPTKYMELLCHVASAKCKSVRKQYAVLPDTPGDLTGASKYF
jgi:hypothetical protein